MVRITIVRLHNVNRCNLSNTCTCVRINYVIVINLLHRVVVIEMFHVHVVAVLFTFWIREMCGDK
jgi:hypothetical protein